MCARYLRCPLLYQHVTEMVAERGVEVDASCIRRWVLHDDPILHDRIRGEMRRPNRLWRVDETHIRGRRPMDVICAGRWIRRVRQSTFCSPPNGTRRSETLSPGAMESIGQSDSRVMNVDKNPA